MGVVDESLAANREYAKRFNLGDLAMPPSRRLAVVACMDARLTVEEFLGLKTGEAHIIRNAGGLVTEDAIRSLVISHHLLKTNEFMVIQHTDCGMLTFQDHALRKTLVQHTAADPIAPAVFHAFPDVKRSVSAQIERIRSHPWIPESVAVRGFVFDVKTGRLKEVAG